MSIVNGFVKKINKAYIDNNYEKVLSELYPQRKESVLKLRNRQAVYASITAGELLIEAYDSVYGSGGKLLSVVKSEGGKPYIKDREEFKFNISHSGDYVIIAYSTEPDIKSIGADIEKVRQRDDDMKIANRYFTKSEIDYISDGLECSDIDLRFYKIWTMKEAFIKLTGKGLGQRLDSFSVNPDGLGVEILDDKIYEYFSCDKHIKDFGISYDMKIVDKHVISLCAYGDSCVEFIYKQTM